MARVGSFLLRWGFALLWVTLPFTAGPAFATALDPRSATFRTVSSLGLWLGWVVVLAGALVPRTVSLTLVRIVAPGAVLAAGWATCATTSPGTADGVALAFTLAATIVALAPTTGDVFVNGSSYGDERRFLLRVPGVLLLGPVELTWAAVVIGAAAGPLLLAARAWVAGSLALVAGWAVAYVGARALHVLSQRWVVLVPAGLVLVDPTTLADALMVPRSAMDTIAPALADTEARDLTAGALGLALEIDFREPQTIVPLPPRRLRGGQPGITTEDVDQVLFSPSRPGAVLVAARARRLPVS